MTNSLGETVSIACATCHATTTPNASLRDATQLRQFHLGLQFEHGQLACLSCHNATDYNSLRLANGDSVAFTRVMDLCGQCHGTQLRDYQHGAHGGMTGFWDLTQGPRQRNNCIHCHNAHAPRYPLVRPVFPPNDRNPAAH